MIKKKDLLKNLRDYSAEQIADAVRNNIVSLYELGHNTKGTFTPLLKREVKAILDNSTIKSESTSTDDQTSRFSNSPQPLSLNKEMKTEESIQSNDIDSFDIFDMEEDTDHVDEEMASSYAKNNSNQDTTNKTSETAMFSRPFSTTGTIRRTEYWFTYFIILLISIFTYSIFEIENITSNEYSIVFSILSIPIIWFKIAQGAKRCHDLGNSGWYQLIPFYFILMFFAKGESNNNIYGERPK